MGSLNKKRPGKPDIIIGLPSYNEEYSIERATKLVDKGFQEFCNPQKCLIVNLDSSSEDKTKSIFLNTKTVCPKRYFNTGKNPRGKGKNLLRLFKLCIELDAKYVATIDSDIITLNKDWPQLLLQPLIKKNYDFVLPVYTRNRFEGSTTNHLAYPLIYAVFDVKVRQPIGGDFGLSQRLCKYLIQQQIIDSTLQYGIDIFITCHAFGGGFKITQAFLGRKFHKPSFPKIVPMFKQVLSSAIHTTKIYIAKRRRAKPLFIKSKKLVNIDKLSKYSHRRDTHALLKQMRLEFIKNEKVYQKCLASFFEIVSKIVKRGKPTFSGKLWIDVLSLLLKHYYKKDFGKKSLSSIVDLVTPLFIWRVVSFWGEVERLKPQKIEDEIERQAELLKYKLNN